MQKTNESFQILNFISTFAVIMAGLYLHIPFCASRCIYCGFYSTTRADLRQKYVDALCREMELHKRDGSFCVNTVYLGGGTPSQLTEAQLRQLFIYINKVYALTSHLSPLTSDIEVTIEVNPDDVTPRYAALLRQLGVNRVSMGAQTFDDRRLRFLRRRHTAAQVRQAVDDLRQSGIPNLSVDLMYGFPGESLADLDRDLTALLALDVDHISAYCLMVEEGTPLHRMGIAPCDEELERQMYYHIADRLTLSGYEHYEISNFARPGRRSRHNSSYWHDVPYLGLGAAAHSYQPPSTTPAASLAGYSPAVRSWNVADLRAYIAAVNQGRLPADRELLDADTHYNDRVATALRTSDGLDLRTLAPRHRRYCTEEARRFLSDGLLTLDGDRLRLSRRGLFVSDMVMAGLMLV